MRGKCVEVSLALLNFYLNELVLAEYASSLSTS